MLSATGMLPAHANVTIGQRIAEQGLNNIPACSVCHGMKGEGNKAAGYPRLAGMSADYLMSQLTHYADGSRVNHAMQNYSQALSQQQKQSVADYYATRPGLRPKTLHQPFNSNAKLTELLTKGDWAHNIPACFSCHGDKGAGTPIIPAIADQPAQYIVAQMNHWRTGTRPVGEGDPMATISKNLTTNEIAEIARYLANDKPRNR